MDKRLTDWVSSLPESERVRCRTLRSLLKPELFSYLLRLSRALGLMPSTVYEGLISLAAEDTLN